MGDWNTSQYGRMPVMTTADKPKATEDNQYSVLIAAMTYERACWADHNNNPGSAAAKFRWDDARQFLDRMRQLVIS
jgi:hypothetical protein